MPDDLDTADVDPDPFTIAIGIFSMMVGGGAFLETRRSREIMQRRQRGGGPNLTVE